MENRWFNENHKNAHFFIKFKQINSNKISNLLLDFLIYESGVSSRWVATVNHSILKKMFVFMVYR
jgi:hypothetical protein